MRAKSARHSNAAGVPCPADSQTPDPQTSFAVARLVRVCQAILNRISGRNVVTKSGRKSGGGHAKMMHGRSIRGILLLGALIVTALLQSPANAQSQRTLSLMPLPSSVQQGSGELRIDATFSVAVTGHTEPRLDHSVARFLTQVHRETAYPNLAKGAATGP